MPFPGLVPSPRHFSPDCRVFFVHCQILLCLIFVFSLFLHSLSSWLRLPFGYPFLFCTSHLTVAGFLAFLLCLPQLRPISAFRYSPFAPIARIILCLLPFAVFCIGSPLLPASHGRHTFALFAYMVYRPSFPQHASVPLRLGFASLTSVEASTCQH